MLSQIVTNRNFHTALEHDEPKTRKSLSMIKTPPPFEFLGFDGSMFMFKIPASSDIQYFSANKLTKNSLLTLAPIDWWDNNGFEYLVGAGLTKAVNWLIQENYKVEMEAK